ncbi:glycosyltransferase [Wenzhouxiangella sediminis]|uniref:Glycosyltransferase n=1 Tax=Wenzhouxiangella sediminis TaxID=1792836 RepID=A0A3E1K4Z9_9GAMM|nr:glycosyltransferase [Wenzhouxiangella sediminis]RFF29105.1 glycosyltransferase [Wenzhouxiangella sediminis]
MRILYLTLEPPLHADKVATGNQLRAAMLADALGRAGHEVVQHDQAQWTPREMARRIEAAKPDAVLLGYWQLAEHLPAKAAPPVVVDCIAPRPLEEHFVDPMATAAFIRRYTRALSRAGLLLVGNARQRTLLAAWLLAAGEDLRASVPIAEVPLAVEPPPQARQDHRSPLVLVTGGQDWPWREATDWLSGLIAPEQRGRAELHHFGSAEIGTEAVEHGLASWRQWQEFLGRQAHIGVELSEANFERELAQPFRIASFLQAGLPVLVNDYLPIAELVREYQAGWVVDSRRAARDAVAESVDRPEAWLARARGAHRLARERFNPEDCCRPLVEWLKSPRRPQRRFSSAAEATPAERPPSPSRMGRIAQRLLQPLRREVSGDGVVVITRKDLFPSDHGAAVKILETARGLARLGREVAIVTADRSRYWRVAPEAIHEAPLPFWLRLLALPRAVSHIVHRLRGLPASNAFLYWPLYDPGYGLRAAWVGRRIGASVTLAEFPGYAQPARICRMLNAGRAVLAEHNVEYRRLAEQLPHLSSRAFEKLKASELQLAGRMDAVVCVSDRDRAALIADGLAARRQVTIPHGVDLPAFDAAPAADLAAEFDLDPDRPVLVYHGTFSYPPNRQALKLLVEDILPRLARLGHRVQVLGIGRDAPPEIAHPDLRLPGSVRELAGPLKACDIAVVPLTSGGGTRMKILDYFAAGLPVVSTTKGCEGLPVTDDEQLLIRDDWDEFARAVADLLDNDDRRRALGEAGHEMARSLSWQEIAVRYDRLFRELD